jgi:hypothetical protein
MKTKEDIESFLMRLELPHDEVGDGLWVVHGKEGEQIAIKLAPPLLVCRVNLMDVPKVDREACFQTLLELNAKEMMHGAYGVEDGKVVLSGALQVDSLDFNELQATIDDITLAVTDHYARLARFRPAATA